MHSAARRLTLTFLLAHAAIAYGDSPPAASAKPTSALPFVDDDFAKSLAEARKHNLPLVVDVWAPWCPTCRYMEAQVYTDPAVTGLASRFRWARINLDAPANQAFISRFVAELAFPVLLVIDPSDQAVLVWHEGAASPARVQRLLSDAEASFGNSAVGAADRHLRAADRAFALHQYPQAAAGFTAALAAAPTTWPSRGRAFVALATARESLNETDGCAETAVTGLKQLAPRDEARGALAVLGLGCALGHEGPATTARAQQVTTLEAELRIWRTAESVLFDNRGFAFGPLIEARKKAGDEAGAKRIAAEWMRTAERAMATATTPEARAAAVGLWGFTDPTPADCRRMLPTLTRIAAEARTNTMATGGLARCLRAAGRIDDWRTTMRATLALLADGPTKVRTLQGMARVEAEQGNPGRAQDLLQQAIAIARVPAVAALLTQRGMSREALEAELAKLRAPASPAAGATVPAAPAPTK